ncbi:MAG: M3 family oligoendopeptidase [Anaerolineae bacterium]|nr:M3 family oligoendopeptidase [Gemmatimonadaceae bacterium]
MKLSISKPTRLTIAFAAACICLPQRTRAQSVPAKEAAAAFDAFPGGLSDRYRFDLDKLFFATPEASAIDRRALLAALEVFGRSTASVARTGDKLFESLQRSDSLTGAVYKHAAYLSLRTAIDTRDAAAQRALDSLGQVADPVGAGLRSALAAIEDTTLARLMRERPELSKYEFLIQSARRERSHILGSAEEAVYSALAAHATGWQTALFRTTLASTPYDAVRTPQGDRDMRRNSNELLSSPDRSVREAGFRTGHRALESRRDIFALGLVRTATSRNALARVRRYADYPEESYAERYLTTAQVRETLGRIAAVADVNRRYERAQIAWVERTTKYDTVHSWDLMMPEPGALVPRFTITEASRIIQAATSVLGKDYSREMAALLDPANGRLDLIPRDNRIVRPGFSTGSVGYPSTFFQGRFDGFFPDLVILSHEGGHAVQNMLMTSAGVRPGYSAGPAYFTESFAAFNELLVSDYLARTATTPATRRYYLRQFLDQSTDLFKTAREATFEQSLYDSAATSAMLGPDQLEVMMQSAGSRYSIWFGTDSAGRGQRTMEWVNALHFFTRPLYRVNYTYAKLLALSYFDQYTRDPVKFVPRYLALLRNGYDASPDSLLRRFMGTQLTHPDLVTGAVRVIERRMADFEKQAAGTPERQRTARDCVGHCVSAQ